MWQYVIFSIVDINDQYILNIWHYMLAITLLYTVVTELFKVTGNIKIVYCNIFLVSIVDKKYWYNKKNWHWMSDLNL